MKKKYTKAKVEIIPLKTEAGICTDSEKDTGGGGHQGAGGGSNDDPFETAKAYDFDGVTDFPSDSIPPTKE